MATHTSLPNVKLNPWSAAARWAVIVVQERIAAGERDGYRTDYDAYMLKELLDMEQFLKMSWDVYMHELAEGIKSHQSDKTVGVGHE
jgi:hypothetical protein